MKIGQVVLIYHNGKVVSAVFHPELKLKADEVLLQRLNTVEDQSQEAIKQRADIIFAAWFSRMTEIELADREQWHIVSVMNECVKDNKGDVVRCVLDYSLESYTPVTD